MKFGRYETTYVLGMLKAGRQIRDTGLVRIYKQITLQGDVKNYTL